MTTILKTQRLTPGYDPELARQINLTQPGQAYFADTGPFAAVCGECAFWTYQRVIRDRSGNTTGTRRALGCQKFRSLTGQHGPAVPKDARACRYFERK
jgi:hypothetical protein